MSKFHIILIAFIVLIFTAKADHPLLDEDFFYYIKTQDKGDSFLFLPTEELADGTVIGIVGWITPNEEEDEDKTLFVYCAMEKEDGVSDVYLGGANEEEEFELYMLLEIKELRNLCASLKYVGSDKTIDSKRKLFKRTSDRADEIQQADLGTLDHQFDEIKKIAKLYKLGGRKAVRKHYGKAQSEKILESRKTKSLPKK